MTARGTVGLLAVLAALGAYLWLVELRPPRATGADAVPTLLDVPTAAARVELEHGDHRLHAVRAAVGWTDDAGHPWRSDAVGDLLASLASLRPLMVVDPNGEEAEAYGLATPERLRVVAADGRELSRVDVGQSNPAGTGLYARIDGRSEVVLIGAVLRWELDKLRQGAPEAVRP
jgi:hypothetical protein